MTRTASLDGVAPQPSLYGGFCYAQTGSPRTPTQGDGMKRIHHRTCHLCEAMCGVRIHLEGEEIRRVEGDPDDPFSKGHICPKAVALQDLHDDPDRLRQPMIREGEDFRAASWEEALDAAAAGLSRVREAHGDQALAVYQGNPNVHNYGNVLFGISLVRALGTKNRFSATSVCPPISRACWGSSTERIPAMVWAKRCC